MLVCHAQAETYNNEELESFRRQWKNEIVTSQGIFKNQLYA